MTLPSAQAKKSSLHKPGVTVVGVDVGGTSKGFHSVAISGGAYLSRLATKDVQEVFHWCHVTMRAEVIAIDAPCRWSMNGRSRPAERELMRKGIWCFSTPTRETAVERQRQHALGKASDHYGWMLRGEELFRALIDEYPICRQLPADGRRFCFETFPHAITWHFRGGNADARQKRKQRRELLAQAGLELTTLTNIDLVDATLCALTAYWAAIGRGCDSYGDPDTGLIIVPSLPTV